jgi:hypothetical protein
VNSTNKKSPRARGIPQPFNHTAGQVTQTKPVVAQLKTGVSAQSVKRPVAPPVYRPQPLPKLMQRKMATVAANGAPPVALAVRSSQPSPQWLKPAVSPFRGVVQRAKKKGDKKEPTLADLYAEVGRLVAQYRMDKEYHRWFAVGLRIGFAPPNLAGFHASKPGKAGGKAEGARAQQITNILTPWKAALKEELQVTHGIEEKALGKIEAALGM